MRCFFPRCLFCPAHQTAAQDGTKPSPDCVVLRAVKASAVVNKGSAVLNTRAAAHVAVWLAALAFLPCARNCSAGWDQTAPF
jgi:hypothetical protein